MGNEDNRNSVEVKQGKGQPRTGNRGKTKLEAIDLWEMVELRGIEPLTS